MVSFHDSLDHLLGELERIDLLIRLRVWRTRQVHQADEAFQGLYISEEEIDALLAGPAGMPRWAAGETDPRAQPEARSALAALEKTIVERRAASLREGVTLRFTELERLFGLSLFERDALLICLAPEIDLRYERLFAYLQDDVTKKRPSIDLVLGLLCPDLPAKLAARASFGAQAPLLRHRLLELFDDPSRPQPPLLGRYLKVDDRVADYLLDGDRIDARLLAYARLSAPAARLGDLVLPDDLRRRLTALSETAGDDRILYLQGPYGVGKTATAEALCHERGQKLLAIDLEALLAADEEVFATVLDLAEREAMLQGAALFWRGFDLLLGDERAPRRAAFLRRLEARRGASFLAGATAWEPAGRLADTDFLRLELPRPGHRHRRELWRRALDGRPLAGAADAGELAAKFRFTAGQVRDAAATAASLARRRAPEDGRIAAADLHAACRLHSNPRLPTLAQKIEPRYRWGDIVLPRDRLEQLREVANTARYRARVYEDWGFGRKLSLGKGLNVLFAGPSGTGKTMAAEILASELALDLFRIDLAAVVSKYIGETEKNLARIFSEAETSNAILFFDEADALFGKRSEVRDAHDRYANIEIGYLLQRMEEYEGTAILATNLRKNMDDAFVRRMHFTVDFPFPREADRRRIWEGVWTAEVPRAPELDLDFMARRFEVSGGHIKNIALAAAFLAAADGEVVEMDHLLHATRREYQKMGKIVTEGVAEEYARLGRQADAARRASRPEA